MERLRRMFDCTPSPLLRRKAGFHTPHPVGYLNKGEGYKEGWGSLRGSEGYIVVDRAFDPIGLRRGNWQLGDTGFHVGFGVGMQYLRNRSP